MNIDQIGNFLGKNSNHILTGLGVAGVVGTAYLAAKAAPISWDRIEAAKEQREETNAELSALDEYELGPLSKWEIVKAGWRPYLPAMLVGAATITAIVSSNAISSKRNTLLMASLTLTEEAYREFRTKTREVVGEKKDEEIHAEIAKEKLSKDESALTFIGSGEVNCYDRFSGRVFKSDMQSIRKAENDYNASILNSYSASLNDFYRRLNLPAIDAGEKMGFNANHLLELQFSSILLEDKPVLVVDFRQSPSPAFDDFWA